MRWSWSSFGAGLLGGALLAALLWAATSEPLDTQDPIERGEGGTASAAQPTDERERGSYDRRESSPAAAPPGAEPTTAPDNAPSIVTPAVGGRRHVTPPVTPSTGGDAPINISTAQGEWVQAIADGARLRLHDVRGKQTLRVSFSKVSGDWDMAVFMGVPSNPAQAMLHYAKGRAAAVTSDGRAADRDELHRGETYADRATGLGLAYAAEPPAVDELIAIVLDHAFPDLRGAALLAAAEVGLDVPAVRALILELADDPDGTVRLTAIELLPRLGDAGGRRASGILLSGDYTPQVLGHLTTAVAASDAVAAFLASSPPADAATQVIHHLAARLGDPQNDRDARLAASLPDLVRPLLESPDAASHAVHVLPRLAALGHGAFLHGVAASPVYRTAVRSAAVTAALGQESTRRDGVAAVAAILSDAGTEVSLVRHVLGPVDAAMLEDPTLRSALESAARSHPSAWVRADAEAKLESFAPRRGGTLIIHDAAYGTGDDWVDVTSEIRGAVSGGTLRVQASNEIAGDPKPGHVKILRVEYTLDGTRRLARVTEGERLRIP